MTFPPEIGQRLLLAFNSKVLNREMESAIRRYRPGGITLFRSLNIDNPAQLRDLTDALQQLARELDLPPLLIAADQEGGQLMAVGDATPLPGNMALGATRSPELARRAGEVLGRELSALGVNVNYAPCADVNINPQNPVVGTRSFGEDPQLVGKLATALVEGIQSQGVAATAKHFPGHGDSASDSHYGLTTLPHSLERLRKVELVPFRAAMKAGVKLVMTAHLGIPAIDGPNPPPATLSPAILEGLLRQEMGFEGVVVTDAMNMRAIRQGEKLGEDVVRAASAGADLLLMCDDPQDQARAHAALLEAAQTGRLAPGGMQASLARISRLKGWLAAQPQRPDLGVIRCTEHMQVADEIAEGSLTLVRDMAGLLPIRLAPEKRLAVVVPQPKDLTPADTSSYVRPGLADAIRPYHKQVDEIQIPFAPDEEERTIALQKLRGYDFILIGTINAYAQSGQAELVRLALRMNLPVVVVAMRLPYDLQAFPEAPTFLCTYNILEPSMRAAARALFGLSRMTGQLPVNVPAA